MSGLSGKRIAFLVADGFEQVELTRPMEDIQNEGAEIVILSPESGQVQGVNHFEQGDKFDVDVALSSADASDFDGLVVPGGLYSPDALRINEDALNFVRAFFSQHKPVAAICHGPQVLINAEVVNGRQLTSWKSVRKDLENAGAQWSDEEVVVDEGLVTSRCPNDLDAFCAKAIEEFIEGKHSGQTASAA